MGFLFGKKKKEYDDPNLSEAVEASEEEELNLTNEEKKDISEVLSDAGRELELQGEALRKEYAMTSAYLSDIQLIDNMPEDLRSKVTYHAKNIISLMVDRKMYQSTPAQLSDKRFAMMENADDVIVDDIKEMQNDEKRLSAVERDLKILEGEKLALRHDIKLLQKERKNIGNFMTLFFGLLLFIFVLYIVAALSNTDESKAGTIDTVFLSLMLGMLLLVTLTFTLVRKKIYEIKLSNKKLDRAIFLHNKVKIKYINAVNILDYRKTKYDVDSAYMLSRYYEAYLEEKRNIKKYLETTGELDSSMKKIMQILKSLDLYDVSVWQAQIRALADPKEMVEVRHRLNERRGKLRVEMARNEKRIEELEFEKKIYEITKN